jgi:hypothetical protein
MMFTPSKPGGPNLILSTLTEKIATPPPVLVGVARCFGRRLSGLALNHLAVGYHPRGGLNTRRREEGGSMTTGKDGSTTARTVDER